MLTSLSNNSTPEFNPSLKSVENPTTSGEKITLDSIDVKQETITDLFEAAVKENQSVLQEKKNQLANKKAPKAPLGNRKAPMTEEEKREARKLAKEQKLLRKKKAAAKTKQTFDVIIPTSAKLSSQDIAKLRFSQDSIQNTTSDKATTLDELATNIEKKGWKTGTHLVLVKMPDGGLVSMNNRRLFAVKKVAEKVESFSVPVLIYQHNDMAPAKTFSGIVAEYAKGREILKTVNSEKALSKQEREQAIDKAISKVGKDIFLKSYGHAATLRINTRQGNLSESIQGYDKTVVRHD